MLISKPQHVPQNLLVLGQCMLLVARAGDTMHSYGVYSFVRVGGIRVFLVATPYQMLCGGQLRPADAHRQAILACCEILLPVNCL